MKTIQVKVYSFDELSEEAKQKAIEARRKEIIETGDFSYLFGESAVEQIEQAGFLCPKLQYLLSHSQGDGLNFSGEYGKVKELLLKHLGKGKEKTAEIISEHFSVKSTGNEGRYYFASESDITLIYRFNASNVHQLMEKVRADVQVIYVDLCKKLEEQGYGEWKHFVSNECIAENLSVLHIKFLASGEIFKIG